MKSCPECTATYPDDYAICPKDGAPLHETAMWQVGTVVRGKYRIQARLGEGGMSYVYKAHHELLDELRALKVIKPELARDSEFMSRFKNEAIMARKLNHPNAVRVDDLDIAEDGLPFIAMELVVGDTLKTLVQRAGALPVSLVLDVTSHVCEALDAAHKLGLVHRDIKPENIVLVAQREGPPVAKILDFGISRLREETSGVKGLTQTGMVIGTPEYMSPEQALGKRGDDIDGRSDLYSLGVVMYRMLTGELPFKAETTVEMILQHLRTPPVPPHLAKPELAIPEAVSAIVMKALEKDREKRFATGAEMAAAFKKARGSITLHSRKIDWRALSSASASFGTESAASGASTPSTTTSRMAATTSSTQSTPLTGSTIYRTSARIGPPPREFPTHLVIVVSAAVLVLASVFAGWHYFQPSKSVQQTHAPMRAVDPIPAQDYFKPVPTPKIAPPSTASAAKQLPEHKKLTFDEQAKIIELNSQADADYNQGGCEKALPSYQRVLDIDPHDPHAYATVQLCYARARGEEQKTPAATPAPTQDNAPTSK